MSDEKKNEGEVREASPTETRASDRAVPLMLLGFLALLGAIVLFGFLTGPS